MRALLVGIAGIACVGAAPAPKAMLLKEVKGAEAEAAGAAVCAAHAADCGPAPEVKLYAAPDGSRWAILTSQPAIARIEAGRAAGYWNFRGEAPPADFDPQKTIFPALYPVSPGVWAAAVVARRSEGYSGGGATFEYAAFYALTGKTGDLVADPPFSCSKMVRACFSEKEYATSGHCHEEWEGVLSIAYGPAGKDGRYTWTPKWRESYWPPHKPESAKTVSVVPAGEAGMCGGGPQ